ncbi:hypothetical protein ACU686_18765 [Yinghuangia aomiensis]
MAGLHRHGGVVTRLPRPRRVGCASNWRPRGPRPGRRGGLGPAGSATASRPWASRWAVSSVVVRHAALYGRRRGGRGQCAVALVLPGDAADAVAARGHRPPGRPLRHPDDPAHAQVLYAPLDDPAAPKDVAARLSPIPLLVVHGTATPTSRSTTPPAAKAAAREPKELWIEPGLAIGTRRTPWGRNWSNGWRGVVGEHVA